MNLPKSVVILSFLFWVEVSPSFAQSWKAVPLVSQGILDRGQTGGEGCQVVQAIEIDHTDGKFLLMGTDVGGIYRSIDGGKNWMPCNIGYSARGNAGFAIDPNNPSRAIAVGANSTTNGSHGLYLTTDKGASWKHVKAVSNYIGYRDFKDKVEFLKSSLDSALGYSTVAYWSSPAGGLFRSADGGATWTLVNNSYGSSLLKLHPEKDYVYIANTTGFYRSIDQGASFTKTSDLVIVDMDVVSAKPNTIYITSDKKLFVSTDEGLTFQEIKTTGYPFSVVSLNVSPAQPGFMAVCYKENDWGGPAYISHNGGKNWTKAQRSDQDAFMPFNTRLLKFAWHPTDSMKVWSLGGDWITGSEDGGLHFKWDANGYNGILAGGYFNFNVLNPSLLFLASQDYNGAFTSNNGKSWIYCNASNQGWGGFTYGAYAVNDQILITQNSPGWGQNGYLSISRDGGKKFAITQYLCTGLDVANGDPKDSNVVYFSNFRSLDMGNQWEPMTACKGVFAVNYFGEQEVFGANGRNVVKSIDKGKSWTVVKTLNADVVDLAFDHINNRIYAITNGDRLYSIEGSTLTDITARIPVDQYGNRALRSVAVDFQNPSIVYVAGAKDVYKTDASVKRSLDFGQTWEIITPNPRTFSEPLPRDGANEVFAIRVNPETRELWAAGGCYGIWKFAGKDVQTVKISSPVNWISFLPPFHVPITAEVSGADTGIVRVEFFANNLKIGEDSIAPYSLEWSEGTSGRWKISTRVLRSHLPPLYSMPVQITFWPSQPPFVSVVEPAQGAILYSGQTVEIVANAEDPDGVVKKVSFYDGEKLLGVDSISPYTYSWIDASEGKHSVIAYVQDNSGIILSSLPVYIYLNKPWNPDRYFEDFNDGVAQGWNFLSGSWKVESDELNHSSTTAADVAICDSVSFCRYTLKIKLKPGWDNNYGLIFNYQNSSNYYLVELDANPFNIYLRKKKNGTMNLLKNSTYSGGGANNWINLQLDCDSARVRVWVNQKVVLDSIPIDDFYCGKIGLYSYFNPLVVDDIDVTKNMNGFLSVPFHRPQQDELKMYPNPSQGRDVTIEFPRLEKSAEIRILDLTGRLVYRHSVGNNSDKIILPEGLFPISGMYMIVLTGDRNVYYSRLNYLKPI